MRNPKNRSASIALVRYREQFVRMWWYQVQWKPYEQELDKLPAFYRAGKGTWRAVVLLVCFCIVETHHPNCVLRQFGLVQEMPTNVVYDSRLHGMDLRGKVDRN